MSPVVLPDITTKIPGPRSPGTTRDIPGCPTRHDYQSPTSRNPKKSWDNSGHPGMSYRTRLPKSQVQKSQEVWDNFGTSRDVLPDTTTKVPGSKIPRSLGTTVWATTPNTALLMAKLHSSSKRARPLHW